MFWSLSIGGWAHWENCAALKRLEFLGELAPMPGLPASLTPTSHFLQKEKKQNRAKVFFFMRFQFGPMFVVWFGPRESFFRGRFIFVSRKGRGERITNKKNWQRWPASRMVDTNLRTFLHTSLSLQRNQRTTFDSLSYFQGEKEVYPEKCHKLCGFWTRSLEASLRKVWENNWSLAKFFKVKKLNLKWEPLISVTLCL